MSFYILMVIFVKQTFFEYCIWCDIRAKDGIHYVILTSHEYNSACSHRGLGCLFNSFFGVTTSKTTKLALLAICAGNQPVTGGFPQKGASNAEGILCKYVMINLCCICRAKVNMQRTKTLDALQVTLTTFSASSDKNFVKMTRQKPYECCRIYTSWMSYCREYMIYIWAEVRHMPDKWPHLHVWPYRLGH